ncbi:MAG: hypothetical protein IKN79_00970, partial [Eubacterium sp.]|nr:hypothetical protein [Eubacterium sp.]
QAHCRTAAFIKDGRIIICDRVEKLEETGAKKVTLRGKVSGKLAAELKEMEQNRQGREVAELVLEDRYASFLYGGDISRLLKLLAEERLKDLSITEPTMEEIFMNYYE